MLSCWNYKPLFTLSPVSKSFKQCNVRAVCFTRIVVLYNALSRKYVVIFLQISYVHQVYYFSYIFYLILVECCVVSCVSF